MIKSLLLGSHGLVAYATVFGVLIACGLGVPLPEDISLVLGGYLSHHGAAHLPVMMAVGFCGILGGDSIIYLAGRRIGSKVGQRGGFFARVITPEKRARVQQLFARHGPKVVMIARFLPGVRAVTYFTAGSAGMRYRWFILFDGLAALISAPALVYLGWKFGDEFDVLIDNLKRGQTTVLIAVGTLLCAWFLYTLWKKRREQKQDVALLSAQPVEDAEINVGKTGDHPVRQPASARLGTGETVATSSAAPRARA